MVYSIFPVIHPSPESNFIKFNYPEKEVLYLFVDILNVLTTPAILTLDRPRLPLISFFLYIFLFLIFDKICDQFPLISILILG